MPVLPQERVSWVALHIIPAEPMVRASLRRAGAEAHEIDDLIQDTYCKFAALASVDHIDRPQAFFMQTAKNLWRDRLRRDKVIQFEEFTETHDSFVNHEGASIEATISARHELGLVQKILATLPDRCRTIFTLKRVEGLSQRAIAERLSVTENVVENDVRKAVKALQAELRNPEVQRDIETRIEVEHKHAG